MTELKDSFEIPVMPGEELIIFYTFGEITFSGKQAGQSITGDSNSVVYVEDMI